MEKSHTPGPYTFYWHQLLLLMFRMTLFATPKSSPAPPAPLSSLWTRHPPSSLHQNRAQKGEEKSITVYISNIQNVNVSKAFENEINSTTAASLIWLEFQTSSFLLWICTINGHSWGNKSRQPYTHSWTPIHRLQSSVHFIYISLAGVKVMLTSFRLVRTTRPV